MIYFDNAATSFPKPPAVIKAMAEFMATTSASPGRSGHRMALEASRVVFETRETVAELFNVSDSSRIVFTINVTWALNLVFNGLLASQDHVVTTSLEHNSVMRPLTRLVKHRGIELTVVPAGPDGTVDPALIAQALTPCTRLIVINHASNVTGSIAPIRAISRIKGQALLAVDAAQSAGSVPIDMNQLGIDLLAFTGHKALLGPTGTGGVCLAPGIKLEPLVTGGTGSRSEEEEHPDFFPDCLEAGTPNTIGLAGLRAGIDFIRHTGQEKIREHEQGLTRRLMEGLAEIPEVTVYGPADPMAKVPLVSITVAGFPADEICLRLDRDFGVATRGGLHCAPRAHRTIGTFPHGTIRFSLGLFNTFDEIDVALAALRQIVSHRQSYR
ncbi:MAG: aminotransferase class V-fold PLP-dependent enzyme [Deltaproteobacteria bacterium]|nr:aminotransferase class V-fold PLP-dependent enzyme [Deltaproteobacteria bacterium]